jgi:hypothetical protein
MSTNIIINTSDFISEEMKSDRKFIKNKSRGHKYLEQESKRTQKQAKHIAQLPKKMRNKLEVVLTKDVPKKKANIRTKINKCHSNINRDIQANMDDDVVAFWDAKEEKWDEQQNVWNTLRDIDALHDVNLFWKFSDGEEIVWSEHRISTKDFCEPEPIPISEDYYFGNTTCHPVRDSEEEHNFWEDFEEYESTDKLRNPHLYNYSIYYSY